MLNRILLTSSKAISKTEIEFSLIFDVRDIIFYTLVSLIYIYRERESCSSVSIFQAKFILIEIKDHKKKTSIH